MSPTQSPRIDTVALSWRILRLLNLYRVLVPAALLGVYFATGQPHLVGGAHPDLFRLTATGYLVAAVLSVLALKRRWPALPWHIYVPVSVDVAAATLLTYASGGAESGLGLLLLVPIGAVALTSTMQRSLAVAATGTLALLLQQAATALQGQAGLLGFAQGGYFGAMLFVVSAAGAYMGLQLRASEEVVRQRDIDLANLAELSEYIVQHLRESLVVVDAEDRIRLINESAREILGTGAHPGALLGEISPRLLYFLASWRRSPVGARLAPAAFVAADGGHEVEAHFAPLGSAHPPPVLVFLEDTTQLAERIQQGKLAALGRLSASIAHEIRNPVGAMSHAAQLLAEATPAGSDGRRLTEIISSNASRVSTIIANVLKLSRRESTDPERLSIGAWLTEFLQEFRATLQLPAGQVTLTPPDPDIEVRVDPTQLHQILWNLCDNAARYGRAGALPAVELRVGRIGSGGRPFVEVADRGPGIDTANAERIFEPFFTGAKGGTGLGLFIARELAQCNGALLVYEPRAGGGSIFRVVFSDPSRWEL